jgi:hypothetical protein
MNINTEELFSNVCVLIKTIVREKFSHPLTPHNQIYAAVHFLILAEGYRYLATHYEVGSNKSCTKFQFLEDE